MAAAPRQDRADAPTAGAAARAATDLRVYSRDEVAALLATFAERHRPRATRRGALETALRLLAFRDANGLYWAPDPYEMRWHVHSEAGWSSGGEPAWPVEGPAHALIYLPEMRDVAAPDEAAAKPASGPDATVRTMERMVARAHQSYRDGRLTQFSTETLLRQYVVVDRAAALWAVGCRTGTWHRFTGEAWAAAPVPPSDLPEPDEMEGLGDALVLALMRLIASDAPFPCEAVSDPWRPPSRLPPLAIWADRCPSCGAALAPGQRYCTQCGASRPASPGT